MWPSWVTVLTRFGAADAQEEITVGVGEWTGRVVLAVGMDFSGKVGSSVLFYISSLLAGRAAPQDGAEQRCS